MPVSVVYTGRVIASNVPPKKTSIVSRLLLVEDHHKLLDVMRRGFEAESHEVYCASTAGEGYQLAQSVTPDLMVLDLQLPDEDGLTLLRRLRNIGLEIPVLIATARDSVEHRIEGLDVGADDYIIKPYHFGELSARVRALLRRSQKQQTQETTLAFEDLVMDLIERKASRSGIIRDLTPRQFEVLAYLVRHKNELVTREMLAKDVWRAETATWTNVIEVQITHLRRKLEHQGEAVLLHTVRGEGYVLGELKC